MNVTLVTPLDIIQEGLPLGISRESSGGSILSGLKNEGGPGVVPRPSSFTSFYVGSLPELRIVRVRRVRVNYSLAVDNPIPLAGGVIGGISVIACARF
jgi:hypothetical protein